VLLIIKGSTCQSPNDIDNVIDIVTKLTLTGRCYGIDLFVNNIFGECEINRYLIYEDYDRLTERQ
jgi:hypothetical protein